MLKQLTKAAGIFARQALEFTIKLIGLLYIVAYFVIVGGFIFWGWVVTSLMPVL